MTLSVVPANEVSADALDRVFGDRGPAAQCQCQRYRLASGETFRNTPVEERRHRLHLQAGCSDSTCPDTSGVIALLDAEPIGWCAVAPRASYPGLVRNSSMAAWSGREESRTDPAVWSITCVFVRPGYRRRGVAHALIQGAVELARARKASRLEAYPITQCSSVGSENHPGLLAQYQQAGFVVVHEPSKRRRVVEIVFPAE